MYGSWGRCVRPTPGAGNLTWSRRIMLAVNNDEEWDLATNTSTTMPTIPYLAFDCDQDSATDYND